MNSRQRFLAAAHCQPVDRPPIWLMRQAGRYLPEYRELKAQHDFVTMVRTPELAAEVTLQPLKRFPLDAAVIFSDILVIPEALGQGYHFRDQGGIGMDYLLDTPEKIAALDTSKITEKLNYVAEALKLTRTKMGDEKALLGFCGSSLDACLLHGRRRLSQGFCCHQETRMGSARAVRSTHAKAHQCDRRIPAHADRRRCRCPANLRFMGRNLPSYALRSVVAALDSPHY